VAHSDQNRRTQSAGTVHNALVQRPRRGRLRPRTGETTPVWSITPESLIVSPAPHEIIGLADAREVWGWAWADGGIRNVYVRSDDDAVWQPAEVEPRRGREWQRFSISWTPARRGAFLLSSLAEASNGLFQPTFGRRNAIYEVPVIVA
jgi:hypothetical protein